MRIRMGIVAATLCVTVAVSSIPASAQQHVADSSALAAAISAKTAAADTDRQHVLRALDRNDVRVVASRLGLDIADAKRAVATLTGDDLVRAAAAAQNIETNVAGGQQTIVISVTTLLLIIIIVLLVAD